MSHIRMYKAIALIVSSLLAGCTFLTGSMDITATNDRIMVEMDHATGTARQCFQLNSDQDIRISFIDLRRFSSLTLKRMSSMKEMKPLSMTLHVRVPQPVNMN